MNVLCYAIGIVVFLMVVDVIVDAVSRLSALARKKGGGKK